MALGHNSGVTGLLILHVCLRKMVTD